MDVSTTLSLIQTILTAIQTLGLMQSVCSISNCKAELDDLQNTVQTVKAVLMDADVKQDSLNFQEKNYIQELKDALYDADDVLDEFLTLAKQKQLRSNKVKSFFSRFKLLTHSLSSKVKMVNDRLDTIATKSDKFSFKVDCKLVKFTKEETSSFLSDPIIGREEDVEKIIGVLLGSVNVDHPPVSFLAIVGMGGLGKTALAQLAFNDPRINKAFELKRWTCIADQDEQTWSLKGFLGKVVKGSSIDDKTSLEEIHHEVKRQLGGKKYLLVLDDVWTESYNEWQQFEGFLKVGGRGSWIIVTTRSKTTAQMIAGDRVHVLQGLSKTESWHLFERMAFQAQETDDELVKLGKKIVEKCTNVPLAIRVVGSLLRGQSKSKWLSFHDKGLDYLSETNDTMNRILKLSYDQLNPALKTCFAYCAIFPKDWEIEKPILIRLWMAQGYINTENLGEEYLLILLQRCFFQDILEDEFGVIKSFKIHDLLHDIAEKVAGEEICRLNFDSSDVGRRVRHLSLNNISYREHIFNSTHVRSWVQLGGPFNNPTRKSIRKWTCLRSLDLRSWKAKSLPKSIGQLLHLRSLDLSHSDLKVLPKSITKLVNLQTLGKLANLQTLDLHDCYRLKQLPDDVSKLVDLSTLDIVGCGALSYVPMPAGIGMLTNLQTLGQFVVGAGPNSTSKQCFNGLKDLCHLDKLQGSLIIYIGVLKCAKFVKEEHGGGAYLRNKEHLETIVINFRCLGGEYGSKESEQALLEEMQPHRDVKALELNGYHGETIQRWPGRGDKSALFDFPNLVTLKIQNCSGLLYLPWQIGKLPYLKTLDISHMWNMEYLMDADSEALVSCEGSSFFPTLDSLRIFWISKLKGWWRRSESGSQLVNLNDSGSSREVHVEWVSSPCFPLLKKLSIEYCPQLKSVEGWLEHLAALERLSIYRCPKVELGGMSWHKLAATLLSLKLHGFEEMEELPEGMQFCTSLRDLGIWNWPKLKSIPVLNAFKEMEGLTIVLCPKVELGGMSWHNLADTLQSLTLYDIKEMEELPEGIQYCTSLKYLYIKEWPKLKSIPEWMPKLTSLQNLFVKCSKSLKRRCQKPNGEDWPLIQHISDVEVR